VRFLTRHQIFYFIQLHTDKWTIILSNYILTSGLLFYPITYRQVDYMTPQQKIYTTYYIQPTIYSLLYLDITRVNLNHSCSYSLCSTSFVLNSPSEGIRFVSQNEYRPSFTLYCLFPHLVFNFTLTSQYTIGYDVCIP
jgi:hypothetical protein